MTTARHYSSCPGCDAPIEPGDPIDRIGLAYYCEACVIETIGSGETVRLAGQTYPMSGVYQQEH